MTFVILYNGFSLKADTIGAKVLSVFILMKSYLYSIHHYSSYDYDSEKSTIAHWERKLSRLMLLLCETIVTKQSLQGMKDRSFSRANL